MSRNEYVVGENKNQPQRPMGPGGGPIRFGEKPKDFKGSWKKLIRFARPYMLGFIISILFAVIATITVIVGPSQIQEVTRLITEGLVTGIDLKAVVAVCTFLLILYLVGSAMTYAQGYIMVTATQRFSKSMRTDISHKINRLPLKYFDSTTYGNILSRVTNDIETITMSLTQGISQLVSSVTQFFGCVVMMLITNPALAGVAVLSTLLGFAIMTVIMKTTQKFFSRNQRHLGELNGHIEEIYAGHNVVKAYNGERGAISEFNRINDKLLDSNWKSQFLSGLMMPLMHFISNLGYVAVCVVGAVMLMNDLIRFDVIVAFMLYIRLLGQPLMQLAQAMTAMQSTAAAAERVFEFLGEEEMPDESGVTETLDAGSTKGDVAFENVIFGYNPDKIIIKGFSVNIKAGQKVAIVGPTGAGKTTIVNLLMRFYDTDSGEIRVDGVPLSSITRENVHSLFCMVLQDTWLFEGTVRENIVYSKENVTDDEVKAACKAVGLHHFIRTLPNSYDTVLGDNANLSAGQKQLLTIARAMIENAPLLILDEATSSVDTRTEVLVQRAMDKLTEGRTSFVIAHRLSTIRNADMILVMRDGDIVESGNHEELIEQGGFYATLYNSQFEEA